MNEEEAEAPHAEAVAVEDALEGSAGRQDLPPRGLVR
jgi:hypothetical protein